MRNKKMNLGAVGNQKGILMGVRIFVIAWIKCDSTVWGRWGWGRGG